MPERKKGVSERLDDLETKIRQYGRFAEAVDSHKNTTQRLTEKYEELLGKIGEMHEYIEIKMQKLEHDCEKAEDLRSRLNFALKTLGES
ncbi:MAG: hypothetical protein V3V08_13145 [Nannocystaceae bacterium]